MDCFSMIEVRAICLGVVIQSRSPSMYVDLHPIILWEEKYVRILG
jgi:hypothetical protein